MRRAVAATSLSQLDSTKTVGKEERAIVAIRGRGGHRWKRDLDSLLTILSEYDKASGVEQIASLDAEEGTSVRRLITTDSHLVPPPWLLRELPERLQRKVAGLFSTYTERDGKRFLRLLERLVANRDLTGTDRPHLLRGGMGSGLGDL